MDDKIFRGEIYYADLEPVMGSEQGGLRPVAIIQNDIGNRYSPTVIIAPITSKVNEKHKIPTHILIEPKVSGLQTKSLILLEQIRAIDKIRLKQYIGTINDKVILQQINEAIITSLGIANIRNNNQLVIREVALEKEEKTEFLTRKQIASYGIVAKEYLKRAGNLEISNKLFGEYMLTLIELMNPQEIEDEAGKIVEQVQN